MDDVDGFGVEECNATCNTELSNGEQRVTVEVREKVGDSGLAKEGR